MGRHWDRVEFDIWHGTAAGHERLSVDGAHPIQSFQKILFNLPVPRLPVSSAHVIFECILRSCIKVELQLVVFENFFLVGLFIPPSVLPRFLGCTSASKLLPCWYGWC